MEAALSKNSNFLSIDYWANNNEDICLSKPNSNRQNESCYFKDYLERVNIKNILYLIHAINSLP